MTTPQKAKGSQWERDVAKWLRENGFEYAERRYGAGVKMDKGDLVGIPGVVIECKNLGRITLSTIIDETDRERINADAAVGIAVIKRRGKGPAEAYAMTKLPQMAYLLREAMP